MAAIVRCHAGLAESREWSTAKYREIQAGNYRQKWSNNAECEHVGLRGARLRWKEGIGVIGGDCLTCYCDVRIGEKSRIAQAVA
jgi:hypothetical protein